MSMKKLELSLKEVNKFANLFNSLGTAKGHGLAFQIAKNKHELSKILSSVEEQMKVLKEPFEREDNKSWLNEKGEFVKWFKEGDEVESGLILGHKLTDEDTKELNQGLKELREQTFFVELIKLDEKKFEKACDESIFDGLDVSDYFSLIEKF